MTVYEAVTLEIPAELLTCKPPPSVPDPATATDHQVAELLLLLDDSAADCRSKLRRVAEIYAAWISQVVAGAAAGQGAR